MSYVMAAPHPPAPSPAGAALSEVEGRRGKSPSPVGEGYTAVFAVMWDILIPLSCPLAENPP